jgi:hypothetical protein
MRPRRLQRLNGPRFLLLLFGAVLACLATSPAHAYVLDAAGKRGGSTTSGANCQYRNTGLRGYLTLTGYAPTVRGANLRRGRRDLTYVRYKVFWMNAYNGDILARSGWSSWRLASDRRRYTWGGSSSWSLDWRGNYYLDIFVEWWKRGRRIGWRDHRTGSYYFYDQYNRGPYGPYSSCAR